MSKLISLIIGGLIGFIVGWWVGWGKAIREFEEGEMISQGPKISAAETEAFWNRYGN